MWVFQLDSVLVIEVLGDSALDGLASFQLEWERLSLSWTTGDIADTVLSAHLSAVSDLNLQSTDLFGELDTLSVGEGTSLSKGLNWELENLSNKLNDWHGAVESGG